MSNWEHQKNDGVNNVRYDFGLSGVDTKAINEILNEACHVFYSHADGNWASEYKDKYANLLKDLFNKNPELSGRVIRSNDRVVKMIAYRALKLIDKK